ncbi:MAG: hypothetical protein HOV96_11310 [Nonomuraea sp.]|nr:hypothetical protein [Nonomuraea sp.]
MAVVDWPALCPVIPPERLGPAVVVLVVLAVCAVCAAFVVTGQLLIVLHRLAAGPVEWSKAAAQWQPPEPQHDPVAWGSRSLPPPSS